MASTYRSSFDRRKRGRARLARAGWTLVESMVALCIVVLALVGFSRAVAGSIVTADVHAEVSRAMAAVRSMIEELQAAPFDEVFALYNENPDDGSPIAPGAGFFVEGLPPMPDDPDGLVGEIVFPTVGQGSNLQLREDIIDPQMGMPRDLNGDGLIDDLDHADDYLLLPVIVRVRWRGAAGPAQVELRTMLANY